MTLFEQVDGRLFVFVGVALCGYFPGNCRSLGGDLLLGELLGRVVYLRRSGFAAAA